jgi:hypothetical protein
MNNENETSNQSTSARTTAVKQKKPYLDKCVEESYNRGNIDCNNPKHFYLKREEGAKYANPCRIAPSRIITMMKVGIDAVCECERTACEWAWDNQDRMGLTSDQFVAHSKYKKGIFKPDSQVKRIFQPSYLVPNTDYLHKCLPNVHILNSPFSPTHDHAVSHSLTEFHRRTLYDRLPRGTRENPLFYCDLHGSPGINAAYTRNNVGIVIETLVELLTPKDHVRASAWPANAQKIVCSISEMEGRELPKYAGFISTHSSYYYRDTDYAVLSKLNPNAAIHILCHGFKAEDGMINGELAYKKFTRDGVAMVTQRNAGGSDSYTHPDNQRWFQQSSAQIDADTTMAWTTNQVCPDLWMIKAVFCPISAPAERPPSLVSPDPKSSASFVNQGKVTVQVGSKVLVSAICSGDQEQFFNELRLWISTRPRDALTYRDYAQRWKMLTHGPKKKYSIEPTRAFSLSLAAFYVDSRDQSSLLPMLFEETVEEAQLLRSMTLPAPHTMDTLFRWATRLPSRYTLFETKRLEAAKTAVADTLPEYIECQVD